MLSRALLSKNFSLHLSTGADYFFLQKEHEESVAALKSQLEAERTRKASLSGPDDNASLQAKLSQALAEVSSLQQQLKASESSLQSKKAQLDAGAGPAAAAAAGDTPLTQAVIEERDRAVAALAAQTQAWNAEKEQLKKKLQDMKADFNAKLEAAAGVTPGGPAHDALVAKLQSIDSVLKDSIRKGDLRGAAVDQVGKVRCRLASVPLCGPTASAAVSCCLSAPQKAFCMVLGQAAEYENLALKHPPPPESKSCSIMCLDLMTCVRVCAGALRKKRALSRHKFLFPWS